MEFRSGFIAIMGRPNVGKSTLMNALIGEKIAIVSEKPQTTRGRILGIAGGADWQMVFVDTPGLHKPRTKLGTYMVKAAEDALDGVDIILAMVTAGEIGAQDRAIIERLGRRKESKILAVNKVDAVSRETLLAELNTLHEVPYNAVIPISALRGDGLDELQNMLRTHLPEGPRYFPEDSVTDQPERVLCAEIIREKALLNLREEVPHGIGIEMQAITKLSERLTEIHATIYCEREAHKRIVIGKQGSMLQRIGSAARLDIEQLLDTHIVLRLWVKVREDWRNRPEDLRTLGYE